MTYLPSGGTEARAEDLFTVVRGVTYDKTEARSEHSAGLVPILRANNIIFDGSISLEDLVFVPKRCVSEEQFLKEGDVLFASSSGSRSVVGKSAYSDGSHSQFAFGAFCAVARPKAPGGGSWLSWFTKSHEYRAYVESVALGININNFRGSDFKAMSLPLAPVAEQRRIVAKVDSLSAKSKRAREQLDCTPRLIEKYKNSVLSLALQGVLTQNWRERHRSLVEMGEQPRNKQTRVRRGVFAEVSPPSFVQDWQRPEEWKFSHIGKYLIQGKLIDVKDGNHGANHPKRDEFTANGLPFITAAQLASNRFDVASAPKLGGIPLRKLRVGFAKSGDVILSYKGTVGRVAICTEECVLSPQTTYYGSDRKFFLPSFLRLQLMSPFFQRQLDEVKSQTTRDFVPISQQYELFLLCPNVAEQLEIVKQVEHVLGWVDRLATEASSARKLISHLNHAVLSKAFRGELVPQDPNDEPASVLLERIRGEKNGAVQPRRGRGRPPSVARV